MTNDRTKSKFWTITLSTLVVLTITTTIEDVFDVGVFIIPCIPGFIIYVLATGDIHGWKPGQLDKREELS
jgi:hypothetical protein